MDKQTVVRWEGMLAVTSFVNKYRTIYDDFFRVNALLCNGVFLWYQTPIFSRIFWLGQWQAPASAHPPGYSNALIKKKIKFSSYIRKYRVEQLQSHIWGFIQEGLLNIVYEEMRKYFPVYEEAVSHIWLCNCSILNFPTYEKNLTFFFISVACPRLKR